jgi:type II secretory pathway component PulM
MLEQLVLPVAVFVVAAWIGRRPRQSRLTLVMPVLMTTAILVLLWHAIVEPPNRTVSILFALVGTAHLMRLPGGLRPRQT